MKKGSESVIRFGTFFACARCITIPLLTKTRKKTGDDILTASIFLSVFLAVSLITGGPFMPDRGHPFLTREPVEPPSGHMSSAPASFSLVEVSKDSGWKSYVPGEKVGKNQETGSPSRKKGKLTKSEIKELEKNLSEITRLKKQLLDLYVKYGIIPEEEGKKAKARIDKYYERMKKIILCPSYRKKDRPVLDQVE